MKVSKSRALASLLLLSQSVATGTPDLTSSELKYFEGHIRPLLVENCYKCHSEEAGKQKGGLLLDRKAGWMLGGDSGESVIDLETPEESLLIKMILHDPDYEPMPPKSKLTDAEIARVIEWVKMGAPDPRGGDVKGSTAHDDFDLEKRSKWWSLQPLKQAQVPEVENKSWPLNDYDHFVLESLEGKGWTPSKEADRATLLRRLSVSLTGLAPTPEEMDGFLKDESHKAYEKQVERLLNSPHFGERWARYWMDVARYADSKAYETDYFISYASEYRDYLVRAFNEDVSFDQFVRESFAGDLLPHPRISPATGVNESVIGPGFLLFTDGQHGPPDLHEDEARLFDGMINTATVAFQGLTVSCAKCHDHKFDAITAADYYSLYGLMRSSRLNYANSSTQDEDAYIVLADLKELKSKLVSEVLASAESQAEGLTNVIASAIALRQNEELSALLDVWSEEEKKRHEKRNYSKLTAFNEALATHSQGSLTPELGRMVESWFRFLWLEEDIPELNALRISLIGEKAKQNATIVNDYQLPEFLKWSTSGAGMMDLETPEYLVDLHNPEVIRGVADDAYASGVVSSRLEGAVQSEDFVLDGNPIDLWVRGRDASIQLIVRNYEMAGYGPTTGPLRLELTTDRLTHVHFPTKLWKGETAYIEILHHGRHMKVYRPKDNIDPPSESAYVVFPKTFSTEPWNNFWASSEPSEIAASIKELIAEAKSSHPRDDRQSLVGALFANGLIAANLDDPNIANLIHQGRDLQSKIKAPRYVRSLKEGTIYHEPVYVRGNHKQPSKKGNPKHFLDAFGGASIGAQGSGRLEYAEHLLSTTDFLTSRVRVNRIWMRLFGQGLVSSVDDFGKMGTMPSHPELLDYVALRFIENGWSTKQLIRELVTSRTYRMSSVPSEESKRLDPANIYLQHMPVQRMDAESVRDHILLASGRLDRALHGPVINVNLDGAPPSRAIPHSGPLDGKGRRSIYQAMRRNYLPSFQRAFNMPDPGSPVGQRQVTNVPGQSLTLLNDPFVHQQAEFWAERMLAETGSDEERLKKLHLLAFSRPATSIELDWGKRALKELRGNGDEKSAWTDLCHIMINRKEFIYVF